MKQEGGGRKCGYEQQAGFEPDDGDTAEELHGLEASTNYYFPSIITRVYPGKTAMPVVW